MHVQNLVVKNAIKNDLKSEIGNLNGGKSINTEKNEGNDSKKDEKAV
jgi:hypothetical protein